MSDIAKAVEELGGSPEATEEQNLTLLVNEILILREKLKQAEDTEGRIERRLGKENDARQHAERRALYASKALELINEAINSAKREALADGAPITKAWDDPPSKLTGLGYVGEFNEYPVVEL